MSAALSNVTAIPDKRRDGSAGRIVGAMRRIAADISEANAHLHHRDVSNVELDRISGRLREDRNWLHAQADQLAVLISRGEVS